MIESYRFAPLMPHFFKNQLSSTFDRNKLENRYDWIFLHFFIYNIICLDGFSFSLVTSMKARLDWSKELTRLISWRLQLNFLHIFARESQSLLSVFYSRTRSTVGWWKCNGGNAVCQSECGTEIISALITWKHRKFQFILSVMQLNVIFIYFLLPRTPEPAFSPLRAWVGEGEATITTTV